MYAATAAERISAPVRVTIIGFFQAFQNRHTDQLSSVGVRFIDMRRNSASDVIFPQRVHL